MTEKRLKKYVSYLGYDFTQYIKTDEDVAKFEKVCELEKKTEGVPLRDCVYEVAEVLNLSTELKGRPKRAFVQGNVGSN